MTTTYSGAKISITDQVPEVRTLATMSALSFNSGACALKEVPKLGRSWDKVVDEVVCENSSFEQKGGAKWDPLTYKLTRKPTDVAQIIYETLEDSSTDAGSFKLELPNGSIFYFVAQVSMFSMVDGGSKNTIHTSSVELILQSDPIPDHSAVVAAA